MTISRRIYANNAKTTLASSVAVSDTFIQVSDGSKFPQPGTGEYFLATIEAAGIIEIVKVTIRAGNTFSGVTRAQEGTSASTFAAGSRIDNRNTKETLASFLTNLDSAVELASVDLLDTPTNSTSNNYICHTNDPSGNPSIAYKNTSATWRFLSHRLVQVTGSAEVSSTTTSLISTASIPNGVPSLTSGKYLLQFTTGSNAGLVRAISSSSTGTVSWITVLPSAPAVGDQFEIYIADASVLMDSLTSSDDGLIYAILLS